MRFIINLARDFFGVFLFGFVFGEANQPIGWKNVYPKTDDGKQIFLQPLRGPLARIQIKKTQGGGVTGEGGGRWGKVGNVHVTCQKKEE